MSKQKPDIKDLGELRKKAEEKLRERGGQLSDISPQDMEQIVHELGTYQIELEMQNEELRRAQGDLDETLRKYSDLYDFAPVGYFTFNKDGLIIEANITGADMLGTNRRALLGKPFTPFVASEDREIFRVHRMDTIRRQARQTCEIRINGKDGKVLFVQLQSVAFEDSTGTLNCRTAVLDITERKVVEDERMRAEAELLNLQKLESLRVLAGGIAHDLNNLMVSVVGNAGLALRELPPGSTARVYVDNIEKATSKVSHFSKQILSFTSKLAAEKEPVQLNEIIKDTVALLIASISKKADLEYSLLDGIPLIIANSQNMQQVVMNLIVNASEALGGTNGKINISTGTLQAGRQYLDTLQPGGLPEGEYAYIEVADTGSGMSPETRKKIFDPFYSTKFAGRGLGLSAVFGILKAHGGAIGLESAEGRGTTFRALLPLPAKPVKVAPAKPEPVNLWNGEGAAILVVDDEEPSRIMAKKVLESAGYKVLTAEDGPGAIEVLRMNAGSISAVIMDLIMPHMRGDEAAKEIRKIRDDLNILFLSGYHEVNLTELTGGSGKTAILEKPYRIAKLLEAVQDMLKA